MLPLSSNSYDYCLNDPVGKLDPSGLYTLAELMKTLNTWAKVADTYITRIQSYKRFEKITKATGVVLIFIGGLMLPIKIKDKLYYSFRLSRLGKEIPDVELGVFVKNGKPIDLEIVLIWGADLRATYKFNINDPFNPILKNWGTNITLLKEEFFRANLTFRQIVDIGPDEGDIEMGLVFDFGLRIGDWGAFDTKFSHTFFNLTDELKNGVIMHLIMAGLD